MTELTEDLKRSGSFPTLADRNKNEWRIDWNYFLPSHIIP